MQNRNRRPFNDTWATEELDLAVRAVVFDYGMVLTGPPAPEAHNELLRITGLSADRLDSLYWAHRRAFDEGKLTGPAFWAKVANEAALNLTADQLAELSDLDARMWTTENLSMLSWQKALNERGFLTAILSNMGESVHARMEQQFKWLSRFDVLVWSYRLGIAKPDARIYLHTLKELGTRPEETLFLDDKLVNVEAASGLGMQGVLFSTVDQLRLDLAASGLDAELPLP